MNALLIKSLNLGVIDSALSWLIGAITTLLMWIVEWTLDLLVALLAGLLYSVGLVLLNLVDFFQAFFNALCGMGTYWDAKGTPYTDQDPIISLVTNDTVLQVFLALTIVAVIMLILTTIIAMIRTEYTTEGAKNTKGNIIGTALKSLAMFFIVPVSCVFGILLCSGVLKAVYNATSGGDGVTAGGMVWYASSYNANKLRTNEETISSLKDKGYLVDFGVPATSEDVETLAIKIDNAFKSGTIQITVDDLKEKASDIGYSITDFTQQNTQSGGRYTYRSQDLTGEFYTIKKMNFIVLFLGGGMAVYIMFIAAFGLIIRLYKCTILFIISAPVTALTPLDGGSAYKSWRKLMIGAVASAFAIVVAFNLIFLLIPIMSEINIFNTEISHLRYWNRLVNLMFVLTGLYSIKETSKWVASMLGIEDPLAAGTEISGKVMGTVGKIGAVSGNFAVGTAAKFAAKGASIVASKKQALSDKLQDEDPEKAAKLRKSAERGVAFAGFMGKHGDSLTEKGAGVVTKTMGQKLQKFDDFMGGTKMIYDTDNEGKPKGGIGGLATKGVGALYSASSTAIGSLAASTVYGAGAGVAGGVKAIAKGRPGRSAEEMMSDGITGGLKGFATGFKGPYEKKVIDGKTHYYKGGSEISESDYKKGTTLKARAKDYFGGAHGTSYAAEMAAQRKKSQAESQEISRILDDAGKKLADTMKDVIDKIAAYGEGTLYDKGSGKLTDTGRDVLGEQLLEIRSLSNIKGADGQKINIDELAAKFVGPDASINAKNISADQEVIRKQYEKERGEQIVNMGGVHIEMMSDNLKDALHSAFSGMHIEGPDLSSQIKEIQNKLQKEFDKQRQEMEKERKYINQLAVAIAKYGKRLNPGK